MGEERGYTPDEAYAAAILKPAFWEWKRQRDGDGK